MSGDAVGALVLLLPVLLLSVVLHEWAHARVAVAQGDDTPLRAGRLTLNPLPHLSLMGSLVVPVALWLMPGGFIFGWAEPVPVNPDNFRDRKRGDVLVSLAGVAANFALAAACVAVWALAARLGGGAPLAEGIQRMAGFGILINLILAVFNLLPVPPLDGSHVVRNLLPRRAAEAYERLGRFSPVLLLAVFLFPGLLDVVFRPVLSLHGWAMELARTLG